MVKLCKILLLLLLASSAVWGQERSVYGRVIDSTMHAGINGLIVLNKSSGQLVNTNKTGDFFIRAIPGDSILIMDIGYERVGTIYDGANKYPVIATKTQPTMLKEVVITQKRRQELQQEINDFLDNPQSGGAIRDEILGNVVNTDVSSPGIGISIDALYELWSKEGKQRRKVADLKYEDIKAFYVNLKYNRQVAAQITKLSDEDLGDFMSYCKLADDFVLRSTEYELTSKVLQCLKSFRTTRIFGRSQ